MKAKIDEKQLKEWFSRLDLSVLIDIREFIKLVENLMDEVIQYRLSWPKEKKRTKFQTLEP